MINFENAPEVLKISEVADLLKVEPQTIKRYIKAKKMKAIHLPNENSKTIRILKKDIAYLFGGKI